MVSNMQKKSAAPGESVAVGTAGLGETPSANEAIRGVAGAAALVTKRLALPALLARVVVSHAQVG